MEKKTKKKNKAFYPEAPVHTVLSTSKKLDWDLPKKKNKRKNTTAKKKQQFFYSSNVQQTPLSASLSDLTLQSGERGGGTY